MHIRTVPKLEFRYDEVVEHGARLSALIDAAVASDANRHRDQNIPPMDDASLENAV
jgi:ribosome-binding factor A